MARPENNNGAGGIDSALVRRADGRYLTDEWVNISPQLEVSQNGHETLIEKYPLIVHHALAMSADEQLFTNYVFPENGRNSYKRPLHLYNQLGGMHGVSEKRLDAFIALREAISYQIRSARRSGEPPENRTEHVRIKANITEELGLFTMDVEEIQHALDDNELVFRRRNVSWLTPHKIHAGFSRFDVADQLMFEPNVNRRLGLPEDMNSLQAEYYKRLAYVTDRILDRDLDNEVIMGRLDDAVGAITELVLLGQVRSQTIRSGLTDEITASQAYLHEDRGRMLIIDGAKIKMPRTGFDAWIKDRQSGEKRKLEIKKSQSRAGKKHNAPTDNMPDVTLIRLFSKRSQYADNIKFLKDVRKVSKILESSWRDPATELSAANKAAVDELFEYLDIENMLRETRISFGREVLGIYE